ncbi:unnamed protein product, partial [marine sediment metagenome]
MNIHIGAKEGEIASTVLLPGDPLRAQIDKRLYTQEMIRTLQIQK